MDVRFHRLELAGALGDLGTLLPLGIGLIVACGLDGGSVLLIAGLFYVLSGLYFRTPTPVQPMKVIAAYAIALSLTPQEVHTAGMWMAVILLLLSASGAVTWVGRVVPKSVVRGVQLSTGVLLMTKGIDLVLGRDALQVTAGAAEPALAVSSLGPVPIGIVLGVGAVVLVLVLRNNRYAPAGLVVVLAGAAVGAALGGWRELADFSIGLHLPRFAEYGWPGAETIVLALTALALPQLPMTLGNAVFAQADVAREYFGERARRSSFRALTTSQGLANAAAALFGGMPMCHGAGGTAAHYRFGARTVGANLMIGGSLAVVGLLAGPKATSLMALLPWSVLGALLVFAGLQLSLTLLDTRTRTDLSVALTMLAVAFAASLAWAFLVGIVLAYAFRYMRLEI